MNKESNTYTFIFAIVMVVAVAVALAFTATALKPMQNDNVRKEKMQNILSTIGIETDREGAQEKFNAYVKQQLALKPDGAVDETVDAFKIELSKELKKDVTEQRFPLYVAEMEGTTYYIIPLRGAGLWNAIFGYIALKDDFNTVKGVVFDHVGETPGLGAEITQKWFQERFRDEKIRDGSGALTGITVQKGYVGGDNKDDHAVDAISGATITSNGVTAMISERLKHYLPYIEKQNTKVAIN
ncbi:MAG: NADH:ubiquinone reductase (Na(+)-transporting) subunit C [Sinomicrobium sp.]|nr:NADH:ubiquinone reductase (Na(+)-transporting) subunit C [Sinomicrobium sp.]